MQVYFVADQNGELVDYKRFGEQGPTNNFLGVVCDNLQRAVEIQNFAIVRGISAKIISTTEKSEPRLVPILTNWTRRKRDLAPIIQKLLAEQCRSANTPTSETGR